MEFLYLRDLASRQAQGIRYVKASDPFLSARPAPAFFYGAMPRTIPEWYFRDDGVQGCGFFEIADARLFGNALVLQQGAALCLPENGVHPGTLETDAARYTARMPWQASPAVERAVLLTGSAHTVYGHWLVDYMPRLFVFEKLGIGLGTLSIVVPTTLKPFAKTWLGLLGIAETQFIPHDPAGGPTDIEQALIPTGLRGNGRACPLLAEAAAFMRARAAPDWAPGRRKLFVSRTRWGNITRVLQNAEEIEALAAGRGYEVVHPETLSIPDQVRLFASAAVVIGEYGSSLHNAIFSPPSTHCVALRGTEGHPGFLQSGLCEVCGQKLGYVFGETWLVDGHQHYRIDPRDFTLTLDYLARWGNG